MARFATASAFETKSHQVAFLATLAMHLREAVGEDAAGASLRAGSRRRRARHGAAGKRASS